MKRANRQLGGSKTEPVSLPVCLIGLQLGLGVYFVPAIT